MKLIRHQASNGSIQHAALQPDGTARRVEGDILGNFRVTDEIITPGKLLAPLAPTAIFCIGLNYRKHAEESNAAIPQYPVLFMKSPGTLQNPGDDIVLPRHLASDEVDYECELAVIIGKACKNVSKANALDYVLGYTCANDVSARDWQIKRHRHPHRHATRRRCGHETAGLSPARRYRDHRHREDRRAHQSCGRGIKDLQPRFLP
jgi:2-keto-4-pentenoate hydratase/2-oxohepta-3-ene-1,7-dioic acid hydratase in catechol pathway